MKKRSLLTCLTLLSFASAQSGVTVEVMSIPHGLQLDAGSGPKDFTCGDGRVHHRLKLAGRTVDTSGLYLTITFDGEALRMEAHDQVRPLLDDQVRLKCDKDKMQIKIGSLITVRETD